MRGRYRTFGFPCRPDFTVGHAFTIAKIEVQLFDVVGMQQFVRQNLIHFLLIVGCQSIGARHNRQGCGSHDERAGSLFRSRRSTRTTLNFNGFRQEFGASGSRMVIMRVVRSVAVGFFHGRRGSCQDGRQETFTRRVLLVLVLGGSHLRPSFGQNKGQFGQSHDHLDTIVNGFQLKARLFLLYSLVVRERLLLVRLWLWMM